MLYDRIHKRLYHGFIRYLLREAVYRNDRGFDFWVSTGEAEADVVVLPKIIAALERIEAYDPRRFQRLRMEIPRIWVGGDGASSGSYIRELRLCVLDDGFILDSLTTPEEVALLLVHEATHARLYDRQVQYRPSRRIRIERLCTQAEIAFATKLPRGAALIRTARRKQAVAERVWSLNSLAESLAAVLREQGVPAWVIRVLSRLSQRNVEAKISRDQ